MLALNEVHLGDCLDLMPKIPDQSIDMVLCDLPYGTTSCSWDIIIPFDKLWVQYERLIKPNGAIVLFGSQPFTSLLVVSGLKLFRHELVWEKHQGTNPMLSKISPLKSHENILVFGLSAVNYYPIMEYGNAYRGFNSTKFQSAVYGGGVSTHRSNLEGTRYPKTVLKLTKDEGKRLHPTQKPVALCEYLIKTYTLEGETILDNCAGSGTIGVAAKRLKRNFVLIEKEPKYVEICKQRLENTAELLV